LGYPRKNIELKKDGIAERLQRVGKEVRRLERRNGARDIKKKKKRSETHRTEKTWASPLRARKDTILFRKAHTGNEVSSNSINEKIKKDADMWNVQGVETNLGS